MNTPTTLLARLRAAQRAHDDAQHEARTFHDPDLKPEAVQRRRAELADAARQRLADVAADVRTAYGAASERNRQNLARRPQAPASTAEAWERVKMRLDAGQPLGAIIRDADAETLHAVAAWGPTYLEVNAPDGRPDLAPLERALSTRWADLTGDAVLREALDDGPVLAELEAVLDHAERVGRGDNTAGGLEGALAARIAREKAEASLPVGGPTTGGRGGLEAALAARFADGVNG